MESKHVGENGSHNPGSCNDTQTTSREQSPQAVRPQKSRPRTILSREQVIEIYEHKKTLLTTAKTTAPSTDLARKYHVSSKTIRDIWNGRCWQETTMHLRKRVGAS